MKENIEQIALEVAKFWADILAIDRPIKITFKGKHSFACAAVDEEKRDVIDITLFDISEFNLQEWEVLFLHNQLLHELLHWKYPDYTEETIADMETRFIGLMMKKLKEGIAAKNT
jgi:hypothetical protein